MKLNLRFSLFSRELGYKSYDIEGNTNLLYWPLVNVYFGAAYAKWLFSCDDKYVFLLGAVYFTDIIISDLSTVNKRLYYKMLQTKD